MEGRQSHLRVQGNETVPHKALRFSQCTAYQAKKKARATNRLFALRHLTPLANGFGQARDSFFHGRIGSQRIWMPV